jgi:hypothetical protein
MKILEVQDHIMNIWIGIDIFFLDLVLENQYS